MNSNSKRYPQIVQYWLLLGIFMVFMQVVIGGITRLTESGLSITKWEVVTGTLPPMNAAQWDREFELYRETPQYKSINKGMSLADFKFIYFWEYIHRLWARVMGLVFALPLLYFISRKWIDRALGKRLMVIFLLACLAATFGWVMVASGLVERPWVNAYKLSLHLLIALSVFAAVFWSYLYARFPDRGGRLSKSPLLYLTGVVLVVQILFGGIMAGMKAALVYPTWPEIGSEYIPTILFEVQNWNYENFNNYDKNVFLSTLIHFLHRTTAYLFLIIGLILALKYVISKNEYLSKVGIIFAVSILLQVVLGIVTVLKSVGSIPVFWGVLHQGLALILLSCIIIFVFFNRDDRAKIDNY